ncbi:MAG: TonB-dependent receptor [Bacteroidetes bacterium]|nr:MAG: TonB-dependent receptor [Bacteroidota bacterium]
MKIVTMKRIATSWLIMLITIHAGAQKLYGVIKDSLTQAPMVFATVSIQAVGIDSALQSTVTDEKGRFTLLKQQPGNFEIIATSVGYNRIRLSVTVTRQSDPVNLGTLFLSPRPDMMKEVVVSSKRTLIEEKLDRTVYNVERDKSLSGGDATDALRRVPLLSVDMDGNVTLRGSANIKVLINGKPSTISANNLADALKQIPVDQIKSVEVITSPSVKFDADGSAGIINIVLKQDRLHGILVEPEMAIGTRDSFLGINGAYNNKKMSFSIGGFGRATYNITGIYNHAQTVGTDVLAQQASTRKNELTDNYTLGWEYDMDKHNFLNASVRYSQFNSHINQDNLVSNFYTGSVLDSTLLNQVAMTNHSGTVDATAVYTHSFTKPQQEFSLLALFSRTDGTNGFTNAQQIPIDGAPISQLGNSNKSSNQEITLQADYQAPLSSSQLLEFGGKYIMRDVISNYNYSIATGNDPFTEEHSPYLTNLFSYHQNVTAAYLEYTLNTKSPFSLRAGARYEYAAISAALKDSGEALPSIQSSGVFVPAINVGWRLGNGKLIKLAFTKRIQRPSIQYLNPNVVASYPGSISTGNPALGPEYSDNIELGYNTSIKNMTISFSSFYRHTTNAIESVSLPASAGGTIKRTFANIGKENTAGLNIFANLNLGQKLSLSGGVDMNYTSSSADGSGLQGYNAGWIISGRLIGGYTFTKGWTIYLYSYYQGNQVLLQGYQTGFPYYSLTLKRDLPKKIGTIGIGAANFLSRQVPITSHINSSYLSQWTTNLNNTMSIRIFVSFKLGKLKVEKAERQKKAINNDDLKKE